MESIPSHVLHSADGQPKVGSGDPSLSSNQSVDRIETAVIVTDRVPATTAVNYVSHNKELHEYLPEKYEHDVALLLLQLLSGLHHLQLHQVCMASLKLDHLLLVESGLPGGGSVLVINHIISHLQCDADEDGISSSHDIYASPSILAKKIAEFNVGLLVYEFLHQPNPFAVKTSLITQSYEPHHLPVVPTRSKYSQGLCKLAKELLRKDPSERLNTSQAIGMLQCMLWGPSVNHMNQPDSQEHALQTWLITEQARQVANVCTYCIPGSDDKGTGYSLTDQLHCQFLSDSSVQSLCESMALLH